MELKLSITILCLCLQDSLLIVPYGIETIEFANNNEIVSLLIVPYGIETRDIPSEGICHSLLIVPYGIETPDYLYNRMAAHLF